MRVMLATGEKVNTTSVAAFSQNIHNGVKGRIQAKNSDNRFNLEQLVGLDSISTVYRSVEIAFAADEAYVLNEITKEQRDSIKEAVFKFLDATRGKMRFPW